MKEFVLLICLTLVSTVTHSDDPSLESISDKLIRVLENHTGKSFGVEKVHVRFAYVTEKGAFSQSVYQQGEVIINRAFIECDHELLEKNITYRSLPVSAECDLNEFRSTLTHELGHAFIDRYAKRQHPNSWLLPYISGIETKPSDEMYATYIISEGVGSYFASLIGQRVTKVSDQVWLDKYDSSFLRSFRGLHYFSHIGGAHVVNTIIRQRGLSSGLDYILSKPLLVEIPDLSNVLDYMQSASDVSPTTLIPRKEISYAFMFDDSVEESDEERQLRLDKPFNLQEYPSFVELTDSNFAEFINSEFSLVLTCNGSPFENRDMCKRLLDVVFPIQTNWMCINSLTVGVINGTKYPSIIPYPESKTADEETGETMEHIGHNPFQFFRNGFPSGESYNFRVGQSADARAMIVCGLPFKMPAF